MFRMNRRQRNRRAARRILSFQTLERREVLDGETYAPWVYVPDSPTEQQIADKAGYELAQLYSEWSDWQAAGGEAAGPFESYSALVPESELLQVQDERVALQAFADLDVESLRYSLAVAGFEETASFNLGLAGWLPLGSIDDLAATSGLNFARASYRPIMNVGATTSQGDAAQRTDDVRNTFGLSGSGVTVGVISDSYDTAYQLHSPGFIRATNDVSSGDLPSGVNVLDDSLPIEDRPTDEGRAMLQLVHDVAPAAALSFHTYGEDQMSMRSAILDLQTAGSKVIVDDVLFPDEPMFQDGIIAQAVDQVVSAGVSYFSAAGNYARRSYENTFNAGSNPILFLGEAAHQFATGDIRQSVNIPNGAHLILSFQWDSPFASVGTARSDKDLNIYLVKSGTSQIVAMKNTDNLNRDAVEVLDFLNDSSVTFTTNVELIITLRAGSGPLPFIKYIDLSRPNPSTGAVVLFGEYGTNSPTLFRHPNSEGAISVGAAAFSQTPEFGVTPPLVESFSALAGVAIRFSNAGARLGTPIIREKTDIVGPDNGNTTFFGIDITQDADTFPNFSGTSAAAPHVAGIAALMLQGNSTATPALIEQAMEQTAIDMDNPYVGGFQTGYDVATGWGLVNAFSATYNTLKPSTPDLKNTSDWGFSETDNITFDTTPTLTGAAPAGSYVWIYRDSNVLVDEFQLAAGMTTYERTLTTALSTALHTITVRVAENSLVPLAKRSQLSNALSINILNFSDVNLSDNQSFSGRLSETLVVNGSNLDSSTLRIDWGTSPNPPRSLTKTGTGTVTIAANGISDRTVSVTYVNNAGTTNFNENTGTANTPSATNWTVIVDGTSSASNVVFNTQLQNLAKLDIRTNGVATIAYTVPNPPPPEQEIPYKVLHLRELTFTYTGTPGRSPISIATGGRVFLEENLCGSPKAEARAGTVVE